MKHHRLIGFSQINRSFHDVKDKCIPGNGDTTSIPEPDRLQNAALIQPCAVSASKINQPKLTFILGVDDGVVPRYVRHGQNQRI
jgi:hypothetical protein